MAPLPAHLLQKTPALLRATSAADKKIPPPLLRHAVRSNGSALLRPHEKRAPAKRTGALPLFVLAASPQTYHLSSTKVCPRRKCACKDARHVPPNRRSREAETRGRGGLVPTLSGNYSPRCLSCLFLPLELPAYADADALVGFVGGSLHAVVEAEGEVALFGLHAEGSAQLVESMMRVFTLSSAPMPA